MIIEIVRFDLPPGTDRAKALELYQGSAAAWITNKDLIQKYYFYDETNRQGGGVYIWASREAAQKWHGEEYRAMIRRVYDSIPRIEILDALLHVDPTTGKASTLS
jgi:hypothetical protein